jgi:hypothetical protein
VLAGQLAGLNNGLMTSVPGTTSNTAAVRFLSIELPELLGITDTVHAAALDALAAVLADAHASTICRRRTPTGSPRRWRSKPSAATERWQTLPPRSLAGRSRCSSTVGAASTTGLPSGWRCTGPRGCWKADDGIS